MDYLFAPPDVPSLPIEGDTRRFPVRRIFCIGRNYAEHAREMGDTAERGSPVFFIKPSDALVSDGRDAPYPSSTALLHHEVEMVVALREGGRDLDPEDVDGMIFGHAVGLDLTRRDLQAEAKAQGRPWDTAKGFDHAAPVSAIMPSARARPTPETNLTLHVNGELRQQARLKLMTWAVPQLIGQLSKLFELAPGDLIFTGTPAGVAALEAGDRFRAELEGLAVLEGRIT